MKYHPNITLLEKIDSSLLSEYEEIRTGMVTFLNPYSYLIARSNPQYLDCIDYIAIDGNLLAKLLTFVMRKIERLSFDFTSMANQVFSSLEKNGGNIYFVGSTSDNIEAFVQKIGKFA